MKCPGKAPKRMNAQIRHMHYGHSAYSNPTCALRAPFVWHTSDSLFYLLRARMMRTQTPNKRGGDNPSLVTKLATRRQSIHVS